MNTYAQRTWTIKATPYMEMFGEQAREIAEAMYYVMTGDPYITEASGPIIGRIAYWLRQLESVDGDETTTLALIHAWCEREEMTR